MKTFFRAGTYVVAIFTMIGALAAQSTERALTNHDVAAMVEAHLSDEIVEAAIDGATGHFDLSPNAVAALTGKGVSSRVLAAMRRSATATDVAGAAERTREFDRLIADADAQLSHAAPRGALESLRKARSIDPQRWADASTQARIKSAVETLLRAEVHSGNSAILVVDCDSDCTVRVDSDDEVAVSLKRDERRPIAVTAGTRHVVAESADGIATWRGTVNLSSGTSSRLSVPIADEIARAVQMRQQHTELQKRIENVRAETTQLRRTREQLAADTESLRQKRSRAETRLAEVVSRITTLEKTVQNELAQAERDEQDVQEAQRMAANGSFGANALGAIARGTGAVVAAAKKASADNHRRRAQNALGEINTLTQELYTLTRD